MNRCTRVVAVLVSAVVSGCATTPNLPAPISIEFGQDRYLSDAYLAATPGAMCGRPSFAPGGFEVRAPLPDGTWFRVVAVGPDVDEFNMIALERGNGTDEAQLTMRLNATEGIVRLNDAGREDAWGLNHRWADWMRALGERVLRLDCARAEIDLGRESDAAQGL